MRKIGLHTVGGFAGAYGPSPVIKLVNVSPEYWRQVRQQVGPNTLMIWRKTLGDQPLNNPVNNARGFYNRYRGEMLQCLGYGGRCAMSTYNEIDDPVADAYNLFLVELLRLAHVDNIPVCVGDWSVGRPDLPVVLKYAGALNAMHSGDIVGLHEYWSDTADIANSWHCGRWVHSPLLMEHDLAITECGRDIVEDGMDAQGKVKYKGRPGWQYTCNEDEIIGDFGVYDQLLQRYPRVIGAVVFSAGDGLQAEFAKFRVDSIWGKVVSKMESATVTPPVTPPVVFAFDGRQMNQADFRKYAEGLNLAGTYDWVIMHHSEDPDEALWDQWGGWNYWKGSMRNTYASWGWDRGPHTFVDQVGIGLFTPLNQDGIGVTDNNRQTRHIEIVGNFTSHLPDGKRLDNAVWCAAVMLKAAGLGIDRLTYHKAVRDEKECPGAMLIANWAWFRGLVKSQLDNNLVSQAEIEVALGVEMQQHIIPLNPAASLEKAGALMGLLPAGGEFATEIAGVNYICQAYRLATNRQWQYGLYCITGDWGNVKSFRRAN
jgi:hypothetical protein